MTTAPRSQFPCTVAANVSLCREHFRLTLIAEQFPPTEPGQFIQIRCRDENQDESDGIDLSDWQPGEPLNTGDADFIAPQAMLRRPFSLAGRRDTAAGVELEVIHRVVGVGTDWLSRLKAGDSVSILGPLGNRFSLPEPGSSAILIGGGVGIPPMLYLAEKLAGQNAIAFCGATTRDLLPLAVLPPGEAAEFARHGISSIISTDDGSLGFRGYVTIALEHWLDESGIGCRVSGVGSEIQPPTSNPQPPILYTCGPELMMKRVAAIAAARGLECQIAVERAMACGMGTCQSCCIRVKKPDPTQPPLAGQDWCWRLACTDGPVFRGSELLW